METTRKIKIVPSASFDIPMEEVRNLYIYLALFQYRYIRVPDYNEQLLLKRLNADMKKMLVEVQTLSEQIPNNNTICKIRAAFDQHYKFLSRIVKPVQE